MALYNIADKNLVALEKTTYSIEGLQERYDLQEAIKIILISLHLIVLSLLRSFQIGRTAEDGLTY